MATAPRQIPYQEMVSTADAGSPPDRPAGDSSTQNGVVQTEVATQDHPSRRLKTFDPFPSEPFLLARIDGTWVSPGCLAVLGLVLVFAVLVLINLWQGTLGAFSWGQLSADFHSAWTGDTASRSFSTEFPLLRDWPSLTAAVIALVTPALIANQWFAMRRYVGNLYEAGLLYDANVSEDLYQSWIERENAALGRSGVMTPLLLGLAVISAFLITRTQRAIGVFGAIGGSSGYSKAAYASWWAGQDTHFPGYVTFFIVTTIFLYFVFVQNRVGIRLVWFMWRTKDDLLVGYDLHASDGAFGWRPMRRLLWTVYLSLTVHAGALLVLALTTQASAFIRWLLPITVLYLSVVPLYVFLPLWLFSRRRKRTKRAEMSSIGQELADVEQEIVERFAMGDDCGDRFAYVSLLEGKLARISQVPLTPFRTREIALGIVLYIVPAAAAIIQSFDILSS